jgi:prepilin signal peptidase PulO-like enzyme (type II secretory pathway)
VTVLIMAIAGVIVGFAVDKAIAHMAREPFERGEMDDDDLRLRKSDGHLELGSEAGALTMPGLLTSQSWLRRAAVVAATGVIFGLLGRQYDHVTDLPIVAAYAAVLIVCTMTDILAYRVPNVVTYPAIVAAIVIGMAMPGASRLDVIAGGVIFGGLLFVPAILTGGAMGMGDVKFAFFVGFALGLTFVVPAMLIMAISGGIAAAIMLVTRLRGRGDPIPYAPFIAGGMLVVMLVQGTAFRAL